MFYHSVEGFEDFNATVLWTVAGDGSTEPNLCFCLVGRNANESLILCATHSGGLSIETIAGI